MRRNSSSDTGRNSPSDRDSQSSETVFSQAKAWGFICRDDIQGNRLILPRKQTAQWKMQQIADRWLLIVRDIPQANLHPYEAISFLKRRRETS
jgi:hypothetical protein